MKKEKKEENKLNIPDTNDSKYIKIGMFVVLLMFGVLGIWAAYAPLATSSVAVGKVTPGSAKVPIQNLEGGVIQKIYVHDGENIKVGEPLVKFEDIQIKAQISEMKNQIKGSTSLIESKQQRLASLDEEIKEWEKLFEKKLTDKQRIRQLQREKTQLQGEIKNLKANIQKSKDRITALEDRLKKTVVTSPKDGVVMGIDVHTKGEVIGQGRVICDIIPKSSKYILKVQVNPKDIDKVKVGLKARLSFPSLDMRTLPDVYGRVIYVSADSITDRKTGRSHYEAKIEITKEGLKVLKDNNQPIIVGMPVVAMIQTGKRTLLDYLLKPMVDMLRRSFNEE